MTDQERIAELEAEIESQKVASDSQVAALVTENKLLRGGLAIGGPFEYYRSAGIW